MDEYKKQLLETGRPHEIINFFDDHVLPTSPSDNALWRDRAVVLIEAIIPPLVWQRDQQGIVLTLESFNLANVIALSRDAMVPDKFKRLLLNYLNGLPGYRSEFYNDDGSIAGEHDMSVTDVQHRYLSTQFTRSIAQAQRRLLDKDDIFA